MTINTRNITVLVNTLALGLALATPSLAQNETDTHHHAMKPAVAMKMDSMTSSAFKGVEVNGGTVSASKQNGKTVLSLSSDFSIPKTPAPHWQIVDEQGNTFLLKQLRIVGDKTNLSIEVPAYIKSVSKVQIWCSFAEVVLGEASFKTPIKVR